MLRLYHAPQSRSSRILWLIEEMGIRDEVEIAITSIPRREGNSKSDPDNPHPDKKVPALMHDGELVTESAAIICYLTDLFPERNWAPRIGAEGRGRYLSWLHYYGGVMEPVLNVKFSSMEPDMMFISSFRGFEEVSARLENALARCPYLLGDDISAADILIAAPFIWFGAMAPDGPAVQSWIKRCAERPAFAKISEQDAAWLAG